ncbi:MAG: MucBP domain-containing protein [Clostridia bacterium]|nr:MucBP domain-containing protein [Clostridia bacterium]
MKRIVSLLIAAAMLCICLPAFAVKTSAGPGLLDDEHVRLEGYVVGNKNGGAINEWTGFYTDDLTSPSFYSSMDMSYGAGYYDGYVYGYLYGYNSNSELMTSFYKIDVATRSVKITEGLDAGGEFVFGMAYNYVDNTMYALCNENNPYIASVDLETGALTPVVTIVQSGAASLGVSTFAIDGSGRFLCLSFSATSSKLVEVNKTSGACTQLCDTGYDAYYAQSMTYSAETDCIYWAHADSSSNYKNGLYKISMSDYSVTYLGTIGSDLEITCLYTIPDYVEVESHLLMINYVDEEGGRLAPTYIEAYAEGAEYSVVSPEIEGYTPDMPVVTGVMGTENTTITVTYSSGAAPSAFLGDVNCDGEVDFTDVTDLFAYLMNTKLLTEAGLGNADINADGSLSMDDVSALYTLLLNN